MQDCEPILCSPSGTHRGGSALTRAPSGRCHGDGQPQSVEARSRGPPPLTFTGGVETLETQLNKRHTVHRKAASYSPPTSEGRFPSGGGKRSGAHAQRLKLAFHQRAVSGLVSVVQVSRELLF